MSDQLEREPMSSKPWPESSQVSSTWYFHDSKTLQVHFRKTGSYKYMNVPREVWDKLIKAESIGKFLNQEIKGKYEYTKIA